MNELTIAGMERQLAPLASRFDAVLGHVMNSKHLIQTVLVSLERNDRLLRCTPQSIINGAMTFANLRLPVDGATGQGFLIPFKEIAQPVIGYKGYNTIGARGGLTIMGDVVREGDEEWDFRKGTGGFVRHKAKLDNPGRIVAAWATAESRDRPPAIEVLGIGEILEIKSRSPAVRNKAQTPWNDDKVGFPRMATKTAKRRLASVLPFEIDEGRFLKAARLDEAHDEQGAYSYIREDGSVVIDGVANIKAAETNATPSMDALTGPAADPEIARLKGYGHDAAEGGMAALQSWWGRLTPRQQVALKDHLESVLKPYARKTDAESA